MMHRMAKGKDVVWLAKSLYDIRCPYNYDVQNGREKRCCLAIKVIV